jgi:hypothetical protein
MQSGTPIACNKYLFGAFILKVDAWFLLPDKLPLNGRYSRLHSGSLEINLSLLIAAFSPSQS